MVGRAVGAAVMAVALMIGVTACEVTSQSSTGVAEGNAGSSGSSPAASAATEATGTTIGGDDRDGDDRDGDDRDGDDRDGDGGGSPPAAGSGTVTPTVGNPAGARTIADLRDPGLDPPVATDTAAARFDEANDGAIEEVGAADRWTFRAEAGRLLAIEVITVDHGCSQDLHLVLEGPDGSRGLVEWVGNYGCTSYGPFRLTETGDHVIELAGGDGAVITDATGTYRFVPYWLTDIDEEAATPGQALSGSIAQTLGADRWVFEAQAGVELTVDVSAMDHDCFQDLRMILEDPVGKRTELTWVGNRGCGTPHGPYRLERAGRFVLEFQGGNGAIIADTTGDYSFSFALS